MVKLEDRQRTQTNNRLYRNKKNQDIAGFSKSFVVSCIVLLLFIGVIYWEDLGSSIEEFTLMLRGKQAPKFEFQLPFSQRRQNILIMGVDIDNTNHTLFKGNRSDTIVILSIAPGNKDVSMLSIPRDSKVYIPGTDRADKINHAFARGGVKESIRTIENSFGIRINHYLIVSNKALIDFIDAIDGIEVDVEKDMHYGDNTAGLYVNLHKGKQTLSGKQAEGYVRFRHDMLGDIGRIKRQQNFLNAVNAKLKEPQTLVKLPEALKIASKSIKTDMSFYELSQYALLAKTMDQSDIQSATIPGGPSLNSEISYWIVKPEETQALINKLIYRENSRDFEGPIKCTIYYNSLGEENALKAKEALEAAGVIVTMQSRDKIQSNNISIHNIKIPSDTIRHLKKTIPELQSKSIVYDDFTLEETKRDIVINFNK